MTQRPTNETTSFGPRKKKTRILFMKYRLFHMDPYFIVYDLLPTSLGSISSPLHPKHPGAPFFIVHFSDKKISPRLAINEPPLEPLKATFRKDWMVLGGPSQLPSVKLTYLKISHFGKGNSSSNPTKKKVYPSFHETKRNRPQISATRNIGCFTSVLKKNVEVSRKLLSNEKKQIWEHSSILHKPWFS